MAINAWDSSAYEGFYGPTQNKFHTKGVCKIIRLQVIQQLAYVYNVYRSLKYLFHPNLRCKLQEKIASCHIALTRRFLS